MLKLVSFESHKVFIKTTDNRILEMWRWEARQICRELMLGFYVIEAKAKNKDGEIIDVFNTDSWLVKTKLDINNNDIPEKDQDNV